MKWLGLGLVVVICACVLVLWPTARRGIATRGIPPLPARATIVGYDAGGEFAQWMLVAVSMDKADLDSYTLAITGDGAHLRAIPQEAVVVLEGDPLEQPGDPQRVALRKQTVNGQYLPWWTTEAIRSGWVMSKTLPNECQYTIYVDEERRMVFIYWSYS